MKLVNYKGYIFFSIALFSNLLFSACGNKKSTDITQTAKEYPVVAILPRTAETVIDYPATIQGIQNVEIRPKIDGYVEAIYVDEGQMVKKGQLLFRISAPQEEQNVTTAEASIKIAEADVNAAQMQVDKVRPLVEKDIISEYELESAQYALQSKQAALAQAKVTLNNARINLSYATIYSPADGVIGILPFKIGSLVSSTTTRPLTTVSDIRKIYAYFSINEKQGLELFMGGRGITIQERLSSLPAVSLVLANGTVLPEKGKIETASGLINTQTGSVNMRATFPNSNGLVLSGSSAIVRIPHIVNDAVLIPQKATYQIQGKTFAYLLDDSNRVNSVELSITGNSGQFYIIGKGIKPDDRVVADGIGNLREGLRIKPFMINADSLYRIP